MNLRLTLGVLALAAFTLGCPGRIGEPAPDPDPPEPEVDAGPVDAGPPPCPEASVCAEACCGEDQLCTEDGCVDPFVDLVPVAAEGDVELAVVNFAEDACEVENGCVRGAGDREILQFTARVENRGNVPLTLDPNLGNSPVCGAGAQYPGLFRYLVLDSADNPVLEGDLEPTCVAGGEGFDCEGTLGLAPGAGSDLPGGACPLVDATRIPAGDYRLVILVDPDELIDESDDDNNRLELPFTTGCRQTDCGGVCCPSEACTDDVCLLPDLQVDSQRIVDSVEFTTDFFPEGSCAIFEGCVVEPGERRLLRFDTLTPNLGTADLFFGAPEDNEDIFEFSQCHDHYHFESYAAYRVIDLDGRVVADGHKQAFCLIDTDRIDPTAGPPQYNCAFQGITLGWGDNYSAGLDCQWVDVTGVPPGEYLLEVVVNREWVMDELDFTNNFATVTIEIPDDPSQCFPTDEICDNGQDEDCDGVPDNGCPAITGNGACEDAVEVAGGGTFRFTPSAAAASPSSCGGEGPGGFFRLSFPTDEIAYLSTYASDGEGNPSADDTVLTVWRDGCDGPELVCTDDGCGRNQSHLAREFEAGAYLVEVRHKDPGATGDLQLRVNRAFCLGAEHLPRTGSYDGDNTGELNEHTPVECSFNGGEASEDMYFFTTCPGETAVDFSTCNAEFDTMLEVRQSVCSSNAAVTCNDDEDGCGPNNRASHLSETLRGEGEGDGLWFLLVDGFSQNSEGPYTLEVSIDTP